MEEFARGAEGGDRRAADASILQYCAAQRKPEKRRKFGPAGRLAAYPGTRPWVTFYVETPDVTASLVQSEKLGGRVVMPRTVLPDVTLGVLEE